MMLWFQNWWILPETSSSLQDTLTDTIFNGISQSMVGLHTHYPPCSPLVSRLPESILHVLNMNKWKIDICISVHLPFLALAFLQERNCYGITDWNKFSPQFISFTHGILTDYTVIKKSNSSIASFFQERILHNPNLISYANSCQTIGRVNSDNSLLEEEREDI